MIDCLRCLTLSSLKENHLEFKIMDAKEKNKIKCHEYYLKTKDKLTEAQKERRRETARLAQQRFYQKNKELCKQRTSECRAKRPKKIYVKVERTTKKEVLKQKPIEVIKKVNPKLVHEVLKHNLKSKLWDINISDWNRKHHQEFEKLKQQFNYL